MRTLNSNEIEAVSGGWVKELVIAVALEGVKEVWESFKRPGDGSTKMPEVDPMGNQTGF